MKTTIKNIILFSIIWIISSCSLGEFFSNAEAVEKTEEGLGLLTTLLGAVGGPYGLAAGGLVTTLFSVSKNTYQNKKNKGEKQLAEDAFSTVVKGVQEAKAKLPTKERAKLHKKLDELIPDEVKDLIIAVKESK